MNEGSTTLSSAIADVIPSLLNARRPVLTTHVNPDGDGLGSELALAEWFTSRGAKPSIINHSPTPVVFQWMDEHSRIRCYDPGADSEAIASADVIIVVDTNSPDRLRSMKDAVLASRATKICIDHHLEPERFADRYLIDDSATSTGEIIFRLLTSIPGTTLTSSIATSLYTAIMTDSGSFRYPRVVPETHRIIATLLACGADPVQIYSRVFEQWSNGRMHHLGDMLAGMTTHYQGRLACAVITREMFRRSGTIEEDTDTFTTYPMSIAGVVAGILLIELPDGVKISFRSKGNIRINELAKMFGGNGHANAAGASVHGVTLDAIRQQIITAAEPFLSPTTKGAS